MAIEVALEQLPRCHRLGIVAAEEAFAQRKGRHQDALRLLRTTSGVDIGGKHHCPIDAEAVVRAPCRNGGEQRARLRVQSSSCGVQQDGEVVA